MPATTCETNFVESANKALSVTINRADTYKGSKRQVVIPPKVASPEPPRKNPQAQRTGREEPRRHQRADDLGNASLGQVETGGRWWERHASFGSRLASCGRQ